MIEAFIRTGFKRKKDLFWEWRYKGIGQQFNRSPMLAIIRDDWKLLFNPDRSKIELYDISILDDVELHSCHEKHPELVKTLMETAIGWQKSLPSGPMSENPGNDQNRWPQTITITEDDVLND
jgi:hypothetical protein